MSTFTDQAEALWIAAGGPPSVAPQAAAIAAAESGSGTNLYGDAGPAYSANGSPTSFGLWQIHTQDLNGPVNTLPGGVPYDTNALATNPAYNAAAAVAIFNAAGGTALNAQGKISGFTPWSTYTNGAYLSNLASATASGVSGAASNLATLTQKALQVAIGSTPVGNVLQAAAGAAGIGVGTAPANPLTSIETAAGNGVRTVIVALFGVVIIAGGIYLFAPKTINTVAVKTAGKAALA